MGGILSAWAALQAGRGTEKIFLAHAAQLLHVSRVSITHALEVAVARIRPDVPVVGVGVPDYSDRDKASLTTVTDDRDTAETRLERFVTSTLTQYGRDELISIGAEYGATGWVWRTDGEACDYCSKRDGREYGLDVEFRDHPGCGCYPELLFDDGFNEFARDDMELNDE